MIVMSLIIAAAALLPLHLEPAGPPPAGAAVPVQAASIEAAQHWLALLDGHDWSASWRDTAAPFRAQLTAEQWTAMIRPIRDPLGPVSVRTLSSATGTTTLPGVPPGHYVIAQFTTAFAHKSGAVETVTLSLGASNWHVAGYFIR